MKHAGKFPSVLCKKLRTASGTDHKANHRLYINVVVGKLKTCCVAKALPAVRALNAHTMTARFFFFKKVLSIGYFLIYYIKTALHPKVLFKNE